MYQPWAIILYCTMLLQNAFCQAGNASVQKQLEELRALCQTVQQENGMLKDQLRSRDSLTYSGMRMQIFEAFNTAPKINFDFLNTSDKIAVTGLFTKLLQANNPTSDILGFRFNETILKASEKYFISELKSEHEKIRFGQVVAKLINNPVISTLANTNPITSVTAAIISTVADFSTTTLDVEKDGNKVKDVQAITTDAFSQKNIEAFRIELQPYINFYDALNTASSKYLSGLSNVNHKYIYLKGKVDRYHQQLFASLAITDTNSLIKLANFLPDPASRGVQFEKYLNDRKIVECAALAGKLPLLEQTVRDFRREYDLSLYTFLNEYIAALQSAKKLPATSLDQTKIDALITDIQNFINSESNKSDNLKGFSESAGL
jgi:hypothetical protein